MMSTEVHGVEELSQRPLCWRRLKTYCLAVMLATLSVVAGRAQTTATQVEIIPASPTNTDGISIKLSGTWFNGCIPKNPLFGLSGQTINIGTSNPSEGCIDALTPWSLTVSVGLLPAGSYEIVATYSSPSQKPFEIARKTFTVKSGGQPQELILPIVVNGAVAKLLHYQTTFDILNLSTGSAEAKLQIYDQKGTLTGVFCSPIAPPPSTISVLLNAGGELHRSTSADLPLLNGWARLTWDQAVALQMTGEVTFISASPQPCLLICTRSSAEIITSAHVPAVRAAKEFRAAVAITKNRHTALALVNPSDSQAASVQITLRHPSGELYHAFNRRIDPQNRLTGYVWHLAQCDFDFCPVPLEPTPDMFHGSVQITSDIPIAVAALDILFPEGKYVAVPVMAP